MKLIFTLFFCTLLATASTILLINYVPTEQVASENTIARVQTYEECVATLGTVTISKTVTVCTTSLGTIFQNGSGTTTNPVVSEAIDPNPTTEITTNWFAVPYTFTIGETKFFPDGLQVTLNTINDSRCRNEVQCIWAGELAPTFSLTGGDLGKSASVIVLGSARTKTGTDHTYEFTVTNTTTNEATIIITQMIRKATAQTPSSLQILAPSQKVAAVNSDNPSPRTTQTALTGEGYAQTLITELAKRTNQFRQEHKLPPLKPDPLLSRNATRYSSELLARAHLSHTDKNGCDISCRFAKDGYEAKAWGENLALISFEERPSVAFVANFFMSQWEASSGHRDNLLSPLFTLQGIGVSFDIEAVYVAVHFAQPY